MWTYVQKTGAFLRNGVLDANGYSGHGEGKNAAVMEAVQGVGPIPEGRWSICGPPSDTETHGPYVLRLEPAAGTNTFGRSGFLIHGDSVSQPGTASRGCIILPRAIREQIWNSNDRQLEVVSGGTQGTTIA